MTVGSDTQAHLKIAVAMRAVRGALGINQAEFAKLIGVSKPTVARVETLEVPMRLDAYSNMLQKLKEIGVKVDTLYTESVQVEFEPQALESLLNKLSDPQSRRPDRLESRSSSLNPRVIRAIQRRVDERAARRDGSTQEDGDQ